MKPYEIRARKEVQMPSLQGNKYNDHSTGSFPLKRGRKFISKVIFRKGKKKKGKGKRIGLCFCAFL